MGYKRNIEKRYIDQSPEDGSLDKKEDERVHQDINLQESGSVEQKSFEHEGRNTYLRRENSQKVLLKSTKLVTCSRIESSLDPKPSESPRLTSSNTLTTLNPFTQLPQPTTPTLKLPSEPSENTKNPSNLTASPNTKSIILQQAQNIQILQNQILELQKLVSGTLYSHPSRSQKDNFTASTSSLSNRYNPMSTPNDPDT